MPRRSAERGEPMEVTCLKSLKHPSIPELLEHIRTGSHDVIVMEMLDGDELYTILEERVGEGLEEAVTKGFFYQLCDVLAYTHREGYVHRDIKLENIMIGADRRTLRICDFGMAGKIGTDRLMEEYCGSVSYTAPEILRFTPYDGRLGDVWSAGVVLYAMLTGRLPFLAENMSRHDSNESDRATRIRILEGLFHMPPSVSAEARHIIRAALSPASSRITFEEILSLSWFHDTSVPRPIDKRPGDRLEFLVRSLAELGFQEGSMRDALRHKRPNPLYGMLKSLLHQSPRLSTEGDSA